MSLWLGGQMQQMELDMENQRSIMLGEVATMRQDLQVCSMQARMSAGPATECPATRISPACAWVGLHI